MPFSVGSALNETSDWFLRGDLPRTIASNPIYTGVFIATIVVFLAWLVLPGLGRPRRAAKFWLFSALGITATVFLHDKILFAEKERAENSSVVDSVMLRSPGLVGTSDVPVMPVPVQLSDKTQFREKSGSGAGDPDEDSEEADELFNLADSEEPGETATTAKK